MTVGERLREARKAANLSGEKLGAYIGVSKGQISNIEKGTSDLTKANAIVLAGVLEVSVDWLMNGTGPVTSNSPYNQVRGNRNTSSNLLAGGSIQQQGKGDCEQQLAAALKEIEYLKQTVQDKERIISLIMSTKTGA